MHLEENTVINTKGFLLTYVETFSAMSNFFKSRFGRGSKGGSPARQTSGKSASGESANGPSSPKANVAAMPTSGTDPETCLEVFKSHWLQAVTLMNKVNMAPASGGSRNRAGQEEIEAVRQHIDHLMMLLVEEAGEGSDHHGQVGYCIKCGMN